MVEQATTDNKAEAPKTPATGNEWEWETSLGPVKLSVDIVRRYFCPLANDGEIMHFMAVCKYHGLNPWLRDAYLIKYDKNEAAQLVIGKDTHAKKAEDHPAYKGDEGGIIVRTKDGTIEEREGEFFTDEETLLGGWAKIHRSDRERPKIHRVRLQDWIQTRRDGNPSKFWRTTPAHMIAKVAMAQARHETFPNKYQGLISEDEVHAGPQGREDFDVIDMPLSNAEAAAQDGGTGGNGSAARPPQRDTGVEGAAATPAADAPPAGTAEPSADEQAAIRNQERAEAQPDLLKPPIKVDRGKVWEAVKAKAKAESRAVSQVLQELTRTEGKAGKHNMTDLTDAEVAELAKKLKV